MLETKTETDTKINNTDDEKLKDSDQAIRFGNYVPEDSLTNEAIELMGIRKSSGSLLTAEMILEKIGVERRPTAGPDETQLSMGLIAVQEALGQKTHADCVIVCSTFPNSSGENYSLSIRNELGLTGRTDWDTDVYAGCSGVGRAFMHLKEHEKELDGAEVVVLATELLTPSLPQLQDDPSLLRTIFSDRAVAINFKMGEEGLSIHFAKGKKFPDIHDSLITLPKKGSKIIPYIEEPIPDSDDSFIHMNGTELYRVVTDIKQGAAPLFTEAVIESGLNPSDMNLIVIHPGSIRIVDAIEKNLILLEPAYVGKIFSSLTEGNPSSAAVLLGLEEAYRLDRVKAGDNVGFLVFGAGVYSAAVGFRIGQPKS